VTSNGRVDRHVTQQEAQAALGVVSGRRRQGKTFLLDALTRTSGGFLFTGTESTEPDALRQFGAALGAYLGEPTPLRFVHWDEAITRLLVLNPLRPGCGRPAWPGRAPGRRGRAE
jgi:hypothetical protein